MQMHDCPCSINEIEFFDKFPKQVVLQQAQWNDYHPLNNVSNNDGPIEFSVNGSPDEFIDLNNTMLQLQLKLVNAVNNADLTDDDQVVCVNNWLHSAFSDVQLAINGTLVEGGDHMYPYKAYLSNLLIFDRGTKETQLQSSGWFQDTHGQMNTTANTNIGYKDRKAWMGKSKLVEMCGPLLLDMTQQNKYLLQNTDFTIKLLRSKPDFQVLYTAVANKATNFTVVIQKAILHVRRVKALPSIMNEIEQQLNLENASYPLQRTQMLTYTITSGSQSHIKDALFRGRMPKAVFVGLVGNRNFNGDKITNPFDFAHQNVNHMALYKEGESIPFKPFTPDYTNDLYMREYVSLLQTLNQYNSSENLNITPAQYKEGYCIYGFNLAPDLNIAGHAQTLTDGNLRLEVGFSAATTEVLNVVVMGIFDGKVEITKHRNVLCDWKV